MRTSKLLLISVVCALALIVATACGGSPSPASTPSREATDAPTALPATPVPSPTPEDLGEGSIELIRRGWLSIVNNHISSPDPAPLLLAAWKQVGTAAATHGIREGILPALSGGADEMWDSFSAAYIGLLHATPTEDWDELRFAALTGMASSLNDCHTFFLPPERAEMLTEIRTGRGSGGVGIELAPVRPSYVRETISGGPAEKAGILPGDFLVSVDGKDVTALGIDVITELLKGDPGSHVDLQVRRPGTGDVISFPLTRALVQPAPAEGRILDSGAGYIHIRSFTNEGTLLAAVDKIVAGFEAAGVSSWVIDLRDNPGGDSDLELDGRFIGGQVAERTILRDDGREVNNGIGKPYPEHRIAVLVNSGTASVAEFFAGMLQDYGRARVFGTTTAKCAGFVTLDQFPDGSTLGVTIAHALTPLTEKPMWQTGVIPDETVRQTQGDLAANRDPVLDAAVTWLVK
jgi:carboxyl-terminal processing protease